MNGIKTKINCEDLQPVNKLNSTFTDIKFDDNQNTSTNKIILMIISCGVVDHERYLSRNTKARNN